MKYVVHKNGKFYSFNNGIYKEKKATLAKLGYLKSALFNKGHRRDVLMHRLVARGYVDNPENKPCVNHKNGVKTDNKSENLEWVTHQENTIHSFKTGLQRIGNRGGSLSWDSYEERWAAQVRHKHQTYRKVSKNKVKLELWLKNTLNELGDI